MLNQINIYINEIVDLISTNQQLEKIFLVSGGFGTGKSYLIKQIVSSIKASNAPTAIFQLKYSKDSRFLTELFHNAKIEVLAPDTNSYSNYDLSELEFNYEQFAKELQNIKTLSPKDLEYFTKAYELKSSHYWASNYSDIKEAEKYAVEFVKSNYSKKSIHRLLLETFTVSVESFIVDLMNIFYPFTDADSPIIKKNNEKISVLFTIDDIDSVNGSMYQLLISHLLPYFYSKTFGDFISYHISFIDSEMKVSDFFDFNIVFSSRNTVDSLLPSIPPEIVGKIKNIQLENFTSDDYSKIALQLNLPNELPQANHFEISMGNPLLVFSKIDSANFNEDEYKKLMVKQAFDSITRDFKEKEVNILYVLSFMNGIDNNILAHCKEFTIKSFEVENFLLYNTFLLEKNSNNNLANDIKIIVQNYLKLFKSSIYNSLNLLSGALESVSDYLKHYSESEFEILQTLAFIPEENNFELARIALTKEIDDLESLYKQNRTLFNGKKFLLKSDTSDKIKNFVKIVYPEKFNELSELTNKIQDKIAEEKERIEVQKTAEIKSLEKEINSLDVKINNIKKEYNTYQNKMMHTENLMIDIRRRINNNSFTNHLLVSLISSGFTLSILMIAIFLPNIVQPDNPNSPIYSIQFILYSIFAILFVLSLVFSSKAYNSFKQKSENSIFETELQTYDEEKSEYLLKMQTCKDNIELFQVRKKEIKSILN